MYKQRYARIIDWDSCCKSIGESEKNNNGICENDCAAGGEIIAGLLHIFIEKKF